MLAVIICSQLTINLTVLLRLVLTRGLNVLDGIELCHKRLRWHKRPSRGSVSTRWIKWIRWHCPDFLSYANLIPFKTWNKSTSSPVLLGRLFHLRRSNEWTYNWWRHNLIMVCDYLLDHSYQIADFTLSLLFYSQIVLLTCVYIESEIRGHFLSSSYTAYSIDCVTCDPGIFFVDCQ